MSKITPNKYVVSVPGQPQPSAKTAKKKYKVDLSLNENAFPPSQKAIDAYLKVGPVLNKYPDYTSAELRGALAKKYNLDDQRIVCTAGSEQMLSFLTRGYIMPGDEVIYPRYGFLVYWFNIKMAGGIPVPVDHDDFKINVDYILDAVTDKTRMVFLDNPGNPTATYVPYNEIKKLREKLPEHILLVLDGAYADFVSTDDFDCGFDLVEKYENVVVTRTLSKLYGLSGLRIGWSYLPPDVAATVLHLKGGFNVSSPAQAAGLAAVLDDDDYAIKVRAHSQKWAEWLTKELRELGLKVTPSVCNFILVHFPEGPEAMNAADAYLKQHDINVGSVAIYKLPSSFRVTVGTESENHALINALKDYYNSAQ